jgi:predicted PurR-regulated permease PerM
MLASLASWDTSAMLSRLSQRVGNAIVLTCLVVIILAVALMAVSMITGFPGGLY